MLGMDRFETESLALLPGQRVRARILSHEAWGVPAQIIGHEHVGASVDMIEQFGRALDEQELEAIYPPVGTIIDAVVEQVRRMDPPAWVRLSIRPRDLKLFRWPCGFCGELVTLSPGGGGLILDVRSNDGPGSHTVISHRECLADRLHPDEAGERARALKVGKEKKSLASACSASARGLAVWPLRADTREHCTCTLHSPSPAVIARLATGPEGRRAAEGSSFRRSSPCVVLMPQVGCHRYYFPGCGCCAVRSSAARTAIAAGSSMRSGSPCRSRERRASCAPALRISARSSGLSGWRGGRRT